MSSARYCVYYTPPEGSTLHGFGAAILGYDSARGAGVPHPPGIDGLAGVTGEPRRYGFHATLKAPFRLASGSGEADLVEAAERFARHRPAVAVGPLVPRLIGAFVALVPSGPAPEVDLLAAECVAAFEPFRAPLEPDELARRRPDRLSPRGRALLERWGYPHVFEAFRFHMTLTDALPEGEREGWLDRLAAAFARVDAARTTLDAVTILRQEPGEAFRVVRRCPFTP